MMESKYYTPEIEEFHVGFEYEEFDREKWIKTIIENDKQLSWFMDDSNMVFGLGYIRVKYPDQEDIESLGWESDFDSPGRYEYKDYILYDFNNSNIFTIKQKRSFIKHGQSFVSFDILFEGTIKNKSELKRLMKQIRIL